MISFTNLFIILFLAGAAIVPLAYLFPWIKIAVALYNLSLIWLAALDYFLTRPHIETFRRFNDRAGLGRETKIEVTVLNHAGYAVQAEAGDTPPADARADASTAVSVSLPPHGAASFSYSLVPSMRGDLEFGELFIRIRGRLGLVRKLLRVTPQGGALRVFPDISESRKYELLTRQGYFHLPGMRATRMHGRGTMFERMREYLPDDDSQDINWKATAKVSRPIVMEYEVERNQNVFLMIDTGRLMGMDVYGLSKLDHALRAALVLATVCSLKGDNVGLLAFSGKIDRFVPPGHGRHHLAVCMDELYNVTPTEDESDYATAFEFLLSRKMKRSLVVVFSDFVDIYASQTLIKYLSQLHPGHIPLCVTLRDSDIEDAASVYPNDIQDVFRKTAAMAMLDNRNAVFHRLTRRGVSIINTRPEKLSSELIRKYLELKARLML